MIHLLARLDLNGNPNLGSLALANNSVCLLSHAFSGKAVSIIEEALEVEVVPASIGGTKLLGALGSLNDRAMLVSNIIEPDELKVISEHIDVVVLEDNLNAVGNNLLVGSEKAIANRKYSSEAVAIIQDALGVKVEKQSIGAMDIVGSTAVVNKHGILCHPKSDVGEMESLKYIFGVEAMIGTANFGSPMIGSAIVANDKGAVTGTPTTGVELNRIENALGLI